MKIGLEVEGGIETKKKIVMQFSTFYMEGEGSHKIGMTWKGQVGGWGLGGGHGIYADSLFANFAE